MTRNRWLDFPKVAGIYCFENTKNGKKYIGQSNNIRCRMSNHFRELRRGKDSSQLLQRAWDKYGEESFSIYIVEEIQDIDSLYDREIYFIKELNTKSPNGYNLTEGGYGMLGYEFSEEQKEKRRGQNNPLFGIRRFGKDNPNYKRKHTEEEKQLMSKNHADFKKENHPQWGKHLRDETKDKIRKARLGTFHTEESKKKMSDSNHKLSGSEHHSFGKKKVGTTSDFYGVSLIHVGKYDYWISWLTLDKKVVRIGYFKSELEAAEFYDSYVTENKLPHPLNFPEKFS